MHTSDLCLAVPGLSVVSMKYNPRKLAFISNDWGDYCTKKERFSGCRIYAFFFFITSNSAKRAQSLGVVGNRVTKVFDFHKWDWNCSWRDSKSIWGQGTSSSLKKNDSEFLELCRAQYTINPALALSRE